MAVVGRRWDLDEVFLLVEDLANALAQVLVGAQVVEALADERRRVRAEVERRVLALEERDAQVHVDREEGELCSASRRRVSSRSSSLTQTGRAA